MKQQLSEQQQRFLVQIGQDWRECRLEHGHYVHILHTAWRVNTDHPTITQVRKRPMVS